MSVIELAHTGVTERRHWATDVLEVRDRSESTATLRGRPIVYDEPYRVLDALGAFTERIMPGAASAVLAKRQDVRLLVNHEGLALARTASGTLVLTETGDGLDMTASLDLRSSQARDLMVAIERGDVSQMSVGMVVGADTWTADYEARTITALSELLDVSAVTFPASPTTSLALAERAARRATGDRAERRSLRGRSETVAVAWETSGDPMRGMMSMATKPARTDEARFDALDKAVRKIANRVERNEFVEHIRVNAEPRTYGPANPERSWLADTSSLHALGSHNAQQAAERLEAHGREVVREPAELAYAQRAIRAKHQDSVSLAARDEELRAVSTGGASMGAFAPPVYLLDAFAEWRTWPASFANQWTPFDLPPFGAQVDIPAFAAGDTVAAQSAENAELADDEPTARNIQVPVETVATKADMSLPLYERGGGHGISMDLFFARQLGQQYGTALDTLAWAAALAGAGATVTDAGPLTANGLYKDMLAVAAIIENTAGTVMPPTHIFAPPSTVRQVESLTDGAGHLVFPPTHANGGALVGPVGSKAEGYSGYDLLGASLYADANVPQAGGNNQLVIANVPEALWAGESELIIESFLDATDAGYSPQTLTVVIRARAYVAFAVRYPAAVQTVTGAAFPTTPTY